MKSAPLIVICSIHIMTFQVILSDLLDIPLFTVIDDKTSRIDD